MPQFDNANSVTCHDVFGIIAVQHKQQNYARILALFLMLAAGNVEAKSATRDPLLAGPPQGPCDVSGAGYVAGADAQGNPVPPADAGAAAIPVPGDIAVPLPGGRRAARDRPYVTLDGRMIDRMVNPPACLH